MRRDDRLGVAGKIVTNLHQFRAILVFFIADGGSRAHMNKGVRKALTFKSA